MENLGSLAISVGADLSPFNAAMGGLDTRLKQAERDATSSWSGFEALAGRMTNVGTTLTAAVTAPIVGIGAISARAFGEFEGALNRVSALGEITGKDLERLKAQAIDLGAKTQFSAKQAADGMAELSAAGFKANEVMSAMPGVLDLAASGQMSVGQAAEIAANVMGGFGIKANEVGHAVDVMAKAAASGSLGVNDLAFTFKYVGPVATAAGLSLEEVAAATTLLSNAGIKGEQTGTSLRGAIASLISPSTKAASTLADLGVQTTTADGKLRPFADIVGDLGAKGATTADIFTIFGRETASAMQALVSKGAPALKAMTTELVNSDGAARKMADTLNQGFGGAMERMKGSIETAGIALGESLAPTIITVAGLIEGAANTLASFAKWFNELPEPVKQTTIVIAGLAAALGPALIVIGQMAAGVIAIKGAFVLAAPAVSAFVAAVGGTVATMAPWAAAIGVAAVAIYKLVDAANSYRKAQEDLDEVNTRGADSLNKLENRLRDHGFAVDKVKKEYNEGRISLTQYQVELRKMGTELGKKQKATEKATGADQKAAKAQKEIQAAIAQVQKAAASATRATADYGEETATAARHSETLTKKSEVLHAMARLLEAQHRKAVEAVAKYKLGLDEAANATPKLVEINHQLSTSIERVGESMEIVRTLSDGFQREMNLALSTPAPAAEGAARSVDASMKGMEGSIEGLVTKGKGLWDRFGVDMSGSLGRATTIWDDWSGSMSSGLGRFGDDIAEKLWKGEFSFGKLGIDTLKDLGESFTRDFVGKAIDAGTELLTGVISDLIGGKGFGGIIDRVKDLGKTIADVFGSTSNAAGGVAGAAGGNVPGAPGGGGAAGGGAGALGTINAVTGIVSAVGDVITAIYSIRQEGTLNGIEHNTRYSMMYLGERADGGILGRLYDVADTLKYGTFVQVMEQIRDNVYGHLPHIQDGIADLNGRMQFAVQRLDQIGNDVLYGSHADRDHTGLLAEIRDAVRQGPQANVTVNVSGAASPQATADAIAAQLRTQFAF